MKNAIVFLLNLLSVTIVFSQTRATLFYPLDQTPSSNLIVEDATSNTSGVIIRQENGLPVAISGAAAFSTKAWDFANVAANIEVATNATLESLGNINATTGLSIGFWANHTYNNDANLRLSGMGNVLDILTGQSSGIGTLQFRLANEAYKIITQKEDNVLDGNWHHFVLTLDFTTNTNNFKLYIDGNLAYTQSETVSSSFANPGQTLKIGARSNTSNSFPGKLDEYIIFTQAITAPEVTTLYQSGGYAFSNLPPVVNLGNDTIINPNSLPFSMMANISDDGYPNPPAALTITWVKLSGAGTVTFSPANSGNTSINFSQNDTYKLEITVSDGDYTVKDTIQIAVNNIPPIVDAGANQIITLPTNMVTLNGNATDTDNFPSVLSTLWEKVSGNGTVTFADDMAPITTATFSTSGVYELRLGANDGETIIYDTIKVTVNALTQTGGYTYGWDDFDLITFGNDNLVQDFTDVRSLSHIPAAGVHPRIYFNPDEFTSIKNRLQNTTSGQQVMKQIHAYTTLLHFGNVGYNRSAAYAVDDFGNARIDNTGKWDSKVIYDQLIAEDPAALDGVDNKRRYLLASVMALEAFECYILAGETDTDTGLSYNDRASNLAKAMNYWASLVIDDAQLYPDNYHFFGGIHMAMCYDLNYNSMTTAQQNQVRATLAKLIWEEPIYGGDLTYYATTSNWVGLNSFQLIMNFALEGEVGYKPELTKKYMRTYRNFLNHGWYDSGVGYEGLGKNYQMVTSLVAAARRGYSLLGHPKVKAFGNNFLPAITQPYGYAFTGTDVWGGSGWGNTMGGYKFNASDAIGLKWAFPNDVGVDFMWRNYIGGHYLYNSTGYVYQTMFPATSGYHNYLLLAGIFADDYDTSNDWETQNAAALKNKSFLGPERGLAILRSGFTEKDLMLHFHARQDMGGHTNGDRNNIALSGLGRIWLRYTYGSTFQPTKFHSCVLINDLGVKITPRDGAKARQPGRLVDFQETDKMATVTGDATYAYSWEWEWQGRTPDSDHSWLGTDNWEKVTETWNDFRYQAGNESFYELPFYDLGHWNNPGQLERLIKRPYNPMQKVYRTAAVFKECKPFVLIADNVQKNSEVQNYKSLLQLAQDLTLSHVDVNLEADNYRNDIILKETDGNRRLLVRVLEKSGQCINDLITGATVFQGENRAGNTIESIAKIPTSDNVQYLAGQSIMLKAGFHAVAESDFLAKIEATTCNDNAPAVLETTASGINGNSLVNQLVISTNDTAANFKYLLLPFMEGEALPMTKWNSARNELTVMCNGTEQRIAFTEVDGSTRMNLIPMEPIIEKPTIARNISNKVEKIIGDQLTIIPLPFINEFYLNYRATASNEVQLQIVNLLGQKIHTQSWQVVKGINQLSIPTGNWLAGNYFLLILENGVMVESKQLVKQD